MDYLGVIGYSLFIPLSALLFAVYKLGLLYQLFHKVSCA